MPAKPAASSWRIGRSAAIRRAPASARSAATSGTITPVGARLVPALERVGVGGRRHRQRGADALGRQAPVDGEADDAVLGTAAEEVGQLAGGEQVGAVDRRRGGPAGPVRWPPSSARVSSSCLIDFIASALLWSSVAMCEPWSPLNVCGSQRAKPHSAPWSRVSSQMRSSVGEWVAASDSSSPRATARARRSGPTTASDPVSSRLVSSGVPHCRSSSVAVGIGGLDGRGERRQPDGDGHEVGVQRRPLPQAAVADGVGEQGHAAARGRVAPAVALDAAQVADALAEVLELPVVLRLVVLRRRRARAGAGSARRA